MHEGPSRSGSLPCRAIGTIAAILLLFSPLAAQAGEWRLEKMSGDVRVFGVDRQWVDAKPDQVLRPGESVWTGRRSRVQIATEDGTVILRSGSLVKVPEQALPDGTTVLLQGQGEVRARVRKRKDHHFSIQTPFMAAVVKGTEFGVRVGSATTRIEVTEGQVDAVGLKTRKTVGVKAGQRVSGSNALGGEPGAAEKSGGAGSDNPPGNNDPVDGKQSSGQMASSNGSRGSDDDDDDDHDDSDDS